MPPFRVASPWLEEDKVMVFVRRVSKEERRNNEQETMTTATTRRWIETIK
jgi:hypothetical protein